MERMNVQSELRRILSEAVAPVEVRVRVPAERPGELVVVRRRSGGSSERVFDNPYVEVQVWARTEERAEEVMGAVRGAFDRLRDRGFADGFASVTENACREDYDEVRGSPRWFASYTLKTYKPKKR